VNRRNTTGVKMVISPHNITTYVFFFFPQSSGFF
jgi:hypothetical protein